MKLALSSSASSTGSPKCCVSKAEKRLLHFIDDIVKSNTEKVKSRSEEI